MSTAKDSTFSFDRPIIRAKISRAELTAENIREQLTGAGLEEVEVEESGDVLTISAEPSGEEIVADLSERIRGVIRSIDGLDELSLAEIINFEDENSSTANGNRGSRIARRDTGRIVRPTPEQVARFLA